MASAGRRLSDGRGVVLPTGSGGHRVDSGGLYDRRTNPHWRRLLRTQITIRRLAAVAGLATAILVLAACASRSSLTGRTWQWQAWTTVTPNEQSAVPDPASYTIEFRDDGTFQAKADCNTVSGTYTTSASQALKLTLGPSTTAACPEGSLSSVFIEKLGLATAYTLFRQEMTINQQDLGTMTFK